jgi:hypothetical protein
MTYALPYATPTKARPDMDAAVPRTLTGRFQLPGNEVLRIGPQPQIVGADLDEVANQLITEHNKRINVA